MNRVQGVVKMHFKDKWLWFFLPCLILFSSFIVNLIIGYFITDAIYTGGISSFYLYMLVMGIISLAQSFPFALGFSVRRTDYFWGTVATVAGVGVIMAILMLLLSFVEQWTGSWGVDLHFFNLPYLNEGIAAELLWVNFSIIMNMFFLGFFISSIYRRFGKSGMFTFFILLMLLSTVSVYLITFNYWWGDIFRWLSSHTASELAFWALPFTVCYILLSYLNLRRATI
ncbi:hypothetical protein [Paenibacillus sp. J2TS4]|uniref:hypothetical protein n=1 Tax=Paenibacillus sp. J2TS4 TaxID=2807194 RepID=UPI001B10B589|nr:hypothetical protein [Paenibacillus sp. J2TS4]GIP35406.1 hypothetical protein J2TS4_46160 [Paenibacillus sp. J2TS4]